MEPKEGFDCIGYAAHDESGFLKPFKFKRRNSGPDDVVFRVTHCGICYADVIWTRNFLNDVQYPVVPGHEIVGVVTKVGSNVSNFKVGERVGVGYCAMSCLHCDSCKEGMDSMCVNFPTRVFNAVDVDGTITRGGFSNIMQAHQRFVVKIPDALPSDVAAPLLCAGATVYGPMKRLGMNKPGKKLGVVGLGGVGHIGVLFGKAFGLHVTVFSTSSSKKDEALGVLGADAFVLSKDEEAMKAQHNTLDFIINAASGSIPLDPYLLALKQEGVLVIVGAGAEAKFSPHNVFMRKFITGSSGGGGAKNVQEMLDFVAEKRVFPLIETINIDCVNEAINRIVQNDVRYRFVIDIENSLKPE
jgi:cinnamyl-alcohol dehydrogenase